MQAYKIDRIDGHHQLIRVELPEPQPGFGQVVVRFPCPISSATWKPPPRPALP